MILISHLKMHRIQFRRMFSNTTPVYQPIQLLARKYCVNSNHASGHVIPCDCRGSTDDGNEFCGSGCNYVRFPVDKNNAHEYDSTHRKRQYDGSNDSSLTTMCAVVVNVSKSGSGIMYIDDDE